MNLLLRGLILGGCAVLALLLTATVLSLAPADADLAAAVGGALADSGVSHPVTAVLLNFRAYDTLLEVAVLLVAPLVAAALPQPPAVAAEAERERDPLLQALTAIAVPVALLLAIYLLLIGATRSGGAFHAAAVVAGALVLMRLGAISRPQPWLTPMRQQQLLVLGLALFVAVGWLCLLMEGYFLGYPVGWAGGLILLIESGLTLSLALALWRLMP